MYLLLYITSFVDSGVIPNEQASKDLYQQIMIFSTVLTIVLLPAFGYLGDNLPSKIAIPCAFAIRGTCGYLFMAVENPSTLLARSLCIMLVLFSVVEMVSIEVLFMKGLPADIRGTMMGTFGFFGMCGTLGFTIVGGTLIDRIDPAAPFVFLAIWDSILVILALVFIFLGKFDEKNLRDLRN